MPPPNPGFLLLPRVWGPGVLRGTPSCSEGPSGPTGWGCQGRVGAPGTSAPRDWLCLFLTYLSSFAVRLSASWLPCNDTWVDATVPNPTGPRTERPLSLAPPHVHLELDSRFPRTPRGCPCPHRVRQDGHWPVSGAEKQGPRGRPGALGLCPHSLGPCPLPLPMHGWRVTHVPGLTPSPICPQWKPGP